MKLKAAWERNRIVHINSVRCYPKAPYQENLQHRVSGTFSQTSDSVAGSSVSTQLFVDTVSD